MSFRLTVPCSRAQAEAITGLEEIFPALENPPVLVADEPHPDRPDEWLIHAYFDHQPKDAEVALVTSLGNGAAQVEELGEEDWVTMSQEGLRPIQSGRFVVHTPTYPPQAGFINFEIDAGLAFGTGQHATTSGCLAVLDRLQSAGKSFNNIADIGTGTGVLAFAALALWPQAKCIATDIDSIAIDVARDNAAINSVAVGMGSGELLLAEAAGMVSPLLAARTPFDLIIANILAGPLIELASDFFGSIASGGTVVLAGLLDTQAQSVISAYEAQGFSVGDPGIGEWPVLVCERTAG